MLINRDIIDNINSGSNFVIAPVSSPEMDVGRRIFVSFENMATKPFGNYYTWVFDIIIDDESSIDIVRRKHHGDDGQVIECDSWYLTAMDIIYVLEDKLGRSLLC